MPAERHYLVIAGTTWRSGPKGLLKQESSTMKNNTFAKTIARIALPIVIGGAALGMAGIAHAQDPVGPGYQYSPTTTASPAAEATPGWRSHHGVNHVELIVPGYTR
jgi:hypothetical protein